MERDILAVRRFVFSIAQRTKVAAWQHRLLLSRRGLGGLGLLPFPLSLVFECRLLLCLVLLIRFRRFVAHDEKGWSRSAQSQRGLGRPRLLFGRR